MKSRPPLRSGVGLFQDYSGRGMLRIFENAFCEEDETRR